MGLFSRNQLGNRHGKNTKCALGGNGAKRHGFPTAVSNSSASKEEAWEEKRNLLAAKLARAQADDALLLGSLSVMGPISSRSHGRHLTDAEYRLLQRSANAVAKILEQLNDHLLTEPMLLLSY